MRYLTIAAFANGTETWRRPANTKARSCPGSDGASRSGCPAPVQQWFTATSGSVQSTRRANQLRCA